MEIFCLKCKIKTETNELTAIVFRNGVPAVKGKCAVCGTLKFLITPRRQASNVGRSSRGGSLVNSLLNKLPMPEMHLGLPKSVQPEFRPSGSFNNKATYSFCGPFTKLQQRLNQGYKGVNKLDEACQQHDIAYATSSEVRGRNKADDVLANKASQIVMESDTPDYEKQDARLVTGIIATKSRLGM